MEQRDEIAEFRLKVQDQLRLAFGASENLSDAQVGEIQTLYNKYLISFVNDNNRIWSTGNTFIPLSLAGLFALEKLHPWYCLFLAIGSVALMGFWVLVAENHRAFQTRAQTTVEGIEHYLGAKIPGGKLGGHKIIKWKVKDTVVFTAQNIRWQMFWVVFIIWTAVVILKFKGM